MFERILTFKENFYLSYNLYNIALLSECPKERPTGKCIGNLTCNYGEECCCSKCHPSLVATCLEGQWGSFFTDACMGAGPDGSGCGNNN